MSSAKKAATLTMALANTPPKRQLAETKGGTFMSDVDDVNADMQEATLLIWPPASVPCPATLGMLVRRAIEAKEQGAFKVEIQLKDGRWLNADQIRDLYRRFYPER